MIRQSDARHPGNTPAKEGTTVTEQTITPTAPPAHRNLNIEFLTIPADAPYLMPGDVIHVEATLQVRSVTDGLNYKDEPTSTISARANGTPEVVIRSATLRPSWSGLPTPEDTEDATSAPLSRRERARTWWNRPGVRTTRRTLTGMLSTSLLVAGIVALAVSLSSCGTSGGTPTPSPQAPPIVQTVASCTEATTTALTAEIEKATSTTDLGKRMKATPKPAQCNGLSAQDMAEVASRVKVNITPALLARASDLAGTA